MSLMAALSSLWHTLLNTPDGLEFAIVVIGALVFLAIVAYDKFVRS